MTKLELRGLYLEKRKKISKAVVDSWSENIIEKIILNFNPKENHKIHCFLSIDPLNEVRTLPLIQYCWQNGVRVFVPKIHGNKLISVEYCQDTILEKNSWGILEPQSNGDSGETEFDFVITPLLCCDDNGNRVGYGKGFYDGLFASIRSECKKIGVSFFPPCPIISDIREEDMPLDYLVTPTEVLSFGITVSKSVK